MDLTEIKNLLEEAGFNIGKVEEKSLFGTIQPEHIQVGKNHFTPRFRYVYFADAVGGYYVTSCISGDYRKYRGRHWEPVNLANIFGHGKTPIEAVKHFLKNFKAKKYNSLP
jgi:hypothetical protein